MFRHARRVGRRRALDQAGSGRVRISRHRAPSGKEIPVSTYRWYPGEMNDNTGPPDPPGARAMLTAERAETLERLGGLEREFDGIVEAAGAAHAGDGHDPEGATTAL